MITMVEMNNTSKYGQYRIARRKAEEREYHEHLGEMRTDKLRKTAIHGTPFQSAEASDVLDAEEMKKKKKEELIRRLCNGNMELRK